MLLRGRLGRTGQDWRSHRGGGRTWLTEDSLCELSHLGSGTLGSLCWTRAHTDGRTDRKDGWMDRKSRMMTLASAHCWNESVGELEWRS